MPETFIFCDQIDAWRQEGYSFLVIHELLRQRGVKYSETTVRRYIHRYFPSPVRPVMRRETKPGEVMEVDLGQLGLTWDAATRSRKRTWVFSGRLRHSPPRQQTSRGTSAATPTATSAPPSCCASGCAPTCSPR